MHIREELLSGKRIDDLPLRVCYYARVSTDHELQATSIVNQVNFFIQYIKQHQNWQFVNGYIDEGISGKDTRKRENFLKMIEDGKKGKFDLVLTKSVSRFARNTIDSIQYTGLLLEYGVGVIFLNDNINTFYSDSEFRLTLMASIAQDELRKLSDSVRFGLKQSINRGVVLGNSNILGYQKCNGKLVIVLEEAKIVRDVFYWFVTGVYTYQEVGDMIYFKYGKKLDGTSIRRILMNCKYKGFYCGGKSCILNYKSGKRMKIQNENWVMYRDYDAVPPIVSEELWDLVQMIIESRKRKKVGLGEKYGVICGIHQKKMFLKKKKYGERVYGYYVCNHCISFSSDILNRIYFVRPFEMVYIYFDENLNLMLKCK